MLTFSQLMPSDAKSREEELCEFFGRRRAINDRSLKSRKLHKERKERLVKERLQRAVESELKDSQTGTLGGELYILLQYQSVIVSTLPPLGRSKLPSWDLGELVPLFLLCILQV